MYHISSYEIYLNTTLYNIVTKIKDKKEADNFEWLSHTSKDLCDCKCAFSVHNWTPTSDIFNPDLIYSVLIFCVCLYVCVLFGGKNFTTPIYGYGKREEKAGEMESSFPHCIALSLKLYEYSILSMSI